MRVEVERRLDDGVRGRLDVEEPVQAGDVADEGGPDDAALVAEVDGRARELRREERAEGGCLVVEGDVEGVGGEEDAEELPALGDDDEGRLVDGAVRHAGGGVRVCG